MALASLRIRAVASNQEKSGKLDTFSRSAKSQGILQNGQGNFKYK